MRIRTRRRLLGAAMVIGWGAGLAMIAPAGCSLGKGEGFVHSDALYVKDCVLPTDGGVCSFELPDGSLGDAQGGGGAGGAEVDIGCDNYDLLPDFFAAVPSQDTIQMRIQRGTDLTELSDGLAVLVHDIGAIRAVIKAKRDAAMASGKTEDQALEEEFVDVPVALPAGVQTPGSPPSPPPTCDKDTQLCDVTPVAMALYLQKSCHNQNSVLYAVSGSIRFNSLFSGDPVEPSAAEKLTYANFDVTIGDPRDAPAGGSIPVEKTSRLTGKFRFYFERGKPAQPF